MKVVFVYTAAVVCIMSGALNILFEFINQDDNNVNWRNMQRCKQQLPSVAAEDDVETRPISNYMCK